MLGLCFTRTQHRSPIAHPRNIWSVFTQSQGVICTLVSLWPRLSLAGSHHLRPLIGHSSQPAPRNWHHSSLLPTLTSHPQPKLANNWTSHHVSWHDSVPILEWLRKSSVSCQGVLVFFFKVNGKVPQIIWSVRFFLSKYKVKNGIYSM